MSALDRRNFLRVSGAAAATLSSGALSQVKGANERVNVAVIGVRGRGREHIEKFALNPSSEVVAVVDIDQAVAETAAAHTQKFQSRKPKEYADLRKMLENKDIDAVSIATPNHWHALAAIWACQAGKDVYVEKPASHNIFEGRKMVEAARKYNRIVQVGMQSRTIEHKVKAMQLLREGVIGKLYMARGLCFKRRKTIGSALPARPPAGVEYDIWLGPAPDKPWQENRFHYNWHWYWDFGNGDIGNQGVHEMDIARWGLGKQDLPPRVFSSGGHFIYDDSQETPNTQTAIFDYDDVQLVFEVRGLMTGGESGLGEMTGGPNTIGNMFYGSDGYMAVDVRGFRTFLGEDHKLGPSMDYVEPEQWDTAPHVANFLKAVKSRKHTDLNADIEQGHLSAALVHMANISYRTKRHLRFDPKAEKFVNDAEANKMLTRDYRAPYIVPGKV
jgi:predicted dehydrogenase